ncbi:valine--tRNA ligase, partial [Candidatus Parcubacteria bacterium]
MSPKTTRSNSDIPKVYDPKAVEDRWYQEWLDRGYFDAHVNPDKTPYTIVIPPPNVTAALHMGHAFNNTIQDIIIRVKRKQGYEALWLPGTDHAGIATQNVVEKELRKENLTRHDLGREKFVERVWQWKEKYGSTIIRQLKKMGCSCDWKRERFTMDEAYTAAVKEVFIRLYEKGWIYKGKYIINWCPRCSTALSDEEVEHIETPGHLWYIQYPLKDGGGAVTVATTRPETMLGDTAVAVHPDDERYRHLIGKTLIL